jgi:protein-S-isoprenylcysteine O-methyltransferase Ste14
MSKLIVFGILSLFVIIASLRSLTNMKNHGFYRFFSWECIAWLIASNYPFWFVHPFCFNQIISWVLLSISAYLAITGMLLIKNTGKPNSVRDDKNLFGFEKTTELIDIGVYKYIRHPLYASLIFITWAIYLKNPASYLFLIALVSTNFLYVTSKMDEKECIGYFGEKYVNYINRTRMFIPFVF